MIEMKHLKIRAQVNDITSTKALVDTSFKWMVQDLNDLVELPIWSNGWNKMCIEWNLLMLDKCHQSMVENQGHDNIF